MLKQIFFRIQSIRKRINTVVIFDQIRTQMFEKPKELVLIVKINFVLAIELRFNKTNTIQGFVRSQLRFRFFTRRKFTLDSFRPYTNPFTILIYLSTVSFYCSLRLCFWKKFFFSNIVPGNMIVALWFLSFFTVLLSSKESAYASPLIKYHLSDATSPLGFQVSKTGKEYNSHCLDVKFP